jgi:UDP-glucose 4-epimerase
MGYQVHVIDILIYGNKLTERMRKHVCFHNFDVTDTERLTKACEGAECVYHLAAYVGVDFVSTRPLVAMTNDTLTTHSVVTACLRAGVPKLIYLSTSSVYSNEDSDCVEEHIKVDPHNPYAVAKRYGEKLLKFSSDENLQTLVFRPFNVYGPGQDDRMVIPRFINLALEDKNLTVYDDGTQTRDFTHIEDVVTCLVRGLDHHNRYDLFNLANGRSISLNELAEKIIALVGSRSDIVHEVSPARRKPYDVKWRQGSNKLLVEKFGFTPQTNIDQGLYSMVN